MIKENIEMRKSTMKRVTSILLYTIMSVFDIVVSIIIILGLFGIDLF